MSENETDEAADETAEAEPEPTDEELAAARRQVERLQVALAVLDDESLRRGLATMREPTRLELATQLALPRATMHLGDAIVPLVRRKLAHASPDKQLAVAFAVTESCNDDTIEALGDRHDDPSRDDMLEALPGIVEEHGAPMTTLMLAAYAASDAPCQAVFDELLETDERFALPDTSPETAPVEGPMIATVARRADDPDQTAKREQRKAAKEAKRKLEQERKQALESGNAKRRAAMHAAKRKSKR